ncbi:uncharacterized protein LAESUDRAFT_663296, partial [Laetiporus sulphureus 93-53]
QQELTQLSPESISSLVSPSDPVRNVDPTNADSHPANIIIPRPPDVGNNTTVKDCIVSTMKQVRMVHTHIVYKDC